MEDSGFDSDHKQPRNIAAEEEHEVIRQTSRNGNSALTMLKKSSQLQQKIEKQREVHRKSQGAVAEQPRKGMLARTRLVIPGKNPTSRTAMLADSSDTQPLVMIETDESEDEFALPRLSKQAQKEITQQLIKDGYNLDLEPDDEDLDLIPPRPVHERYVCCHTPFACNSEQCCIQ